MSLEKLNLVELNAQEVQETEGGYSWFWQAAVGTFVYNCFADWEANMKAYQKGRRAGQE